jgi:hypothetical protein
MGQFDQGSPEWVAADFDCGTSSGCETLTFITGNDPGVGG